MLLEKLIYTLMSMVFVTLSFISPASLALDNKKTKKILARGINPKVFKVAEKAYNWAKEHDKVKKPIMTLVDFDKRSKEKRLWVINMESGQVLFNGLVAHGSRSGGDKATHFSNKTDSHMSSLGAYVTSHTYYGKHGLSLRVQGLEKGINDKAASRAIVVHPANYVTPQFVNSHGRAGRSWGCFAINPEYAKKVISLIQGGSFLFAYAPQELNDANFI